MSHELSDSSPVIIPEGEEVVNNGSGEEEVLNNGPSLQDSFAKFRAKKKKERQIIKMCREVRAVRSDEFKENLRLKFVEQCKRYIGVPYGERYKAPDAPVAPLYLDCCALVRKAVQDLQEDFGFVIGKWNQAYQMDTLPIVLNEKTARPGDLVFYEGTYTCKGRKKAQKHNNVHVEVFLGGETGTATIGSRYMRGNVGIFDHYLFKSTAWEIQKVHFRSLDTWLNGECVSHCPEHPWTIATGATNKKSIFDDEDSDVGAGDGEEDVQDVEGDGTVATGGLPMSPSKEMLNKRAQQAGDGKELSPSLLPSITGEKTVEAHVDKVSGVENVCNKLPDIIGSKVSNNEDERKPMKGKLKAMKEVKKEYTPSTLPRTYYVNKNNGYKLVKAALDRRGWQQIPYDQSYFTKFGLKWVERRSDIDYKSHTGGQFVCHFPNNDVLTTKTALVNTLQTAAVITSAMKASEQGVPAPEMRRGAVPWLPDTYQLDSSADVLALLEVEEEIVKRNTDIAIAKGAEESTVRGGTWIYKPSAYNRGRGIKVIRGTQALTELCYGVQTSDPETTIAPARGVIQQYIENPLLIYSDIGSAEGSKCLAGYKFDIRCFMLIARNSPTCVAYYHAGYARLTLSPYNDTDESLSDLTVHLTNAAVQKKTDVFQNMKEFQVQSTDALAELLLLHGYESNAAYMKNQLETDMKLCMVDLVKAANPLLLKKNGYFDLLGCDFMVTADNQLKLLEVNSNPALSRDNKTLESILPKLVDGAIETVLSAQGFPHKIVQAVPVPAVVAVVQPDAVDTAVDTNTTGAGSTSAKDLSVEVSTTVPAVPTTADVRGADNFVLLYDESTGFEYTQTSADSA